MKRINEFEVDHANIVKHSMVGAALAAGPDLTALLARAARFLVDHGGRDEFSVLDYTALLSFSQRAEESFLWEDITARRALAAKMGL